MPTQEERLGNVEHDLKQFKADTVKAYHDVVVDLGMVKGLTIDSVGRLINLTRQVEELERGMVSQFEAQERRSNALEDHLLSFEQNVKGRFEAQDKKLDQVLQQLAAIANKIGQ